MGEKVEIEFSAKEQAMLNALKNQTKLVDKLGRRLEKAGKSGSRAARSTQTGFAGAAGAVGKFVGAFVGVSSVVAGLKAVASGVRDVQNEAAGGLKGARGGLGQLVQLSLGDPEKLRGLHKATMATFKEGGAGTLEEAANMTFSLESAGILDQRKLFSELRKFDVIEGADVFGKAAKTVLTSFGEAETGGVRDIMSKVFAASGFNPATAPPLAEAIARSGGTARALGISDEEVMAGTAILATATGSPEQGGTQQKALLDSLDRLGGFKGKMMKESVAEIGAKGLSGEKLFKLFGRKEAIAAFRVLYANLDLLAESTEKVRKAQEGDVVGKLLATAKSSDALRALAGQRVAENVKAAGKFEKHGVKALTADTLQDALIGGMRTRGDAEGDIFVAKALMKTERFFDAMPFVGGGDKEFISKYLQYAPPKTLKELAPTALREALAPAKPDTSGVFSRLARNVPQGMPSAEAVRSTAAWMATPSNRNVIGEMSEKQRAALPADIRQEWERKAALAGGGGLTRHHNQFSFTEGGPLSSLGTMKPRLDRMDAAEKQQLGERVTARVHQMYEGGVTKDENEQILLLTKLYNTLQQSVEVEEKLLVAQGQNPPRGGDGKVPAAALGNPGLN